MGNTKEFAIASMYCMAVDQMKNAFTGLSGSIFASNMLLNHRGFPGATAFVHLAFKRLTDGTFQHKIALNTPSSRLFPVNTRIAARHCSG